MSVSKLYSPLLWSLFVGWKCKVFQAKQHSFTLAIYYFSRIWFNELHSLTIPIDRFLRFIQQVVFKKISRRKEKSQLEISLASTIQIKCIIFMKRTNQTKSLISNAICNNKPFDNINLKLWKLNSPYYGLYLLQITQKLVIKLSSHHINNNNYYY